MIIFNKNINETVKKYILIREIEDLGSQNQKNQKKLYSYETVLFLLSRIIKLKN